jgi:hypothetical protein
MDPTKAPYEYPSPEKQKKRESQKRTQSVKSR